jgi:multidrug resistance efflux pump
MSDRTAELGDAFSGGRTEPRVKDVARSRPRYSFGFLSRAVALLTGTLIVASYAYTNVLTPVSLEGVVNAPLITLRAPIDGTMVEADAVAGKSVAPSDMLFSVNDSRIDERPRAELAARLTAATQQRQLLDNSITDLERISNDLLQRDGVYVAAQQDMLQARLRAGQAAISGAASAVINARKQEARTRELAGAGVVPRVQLENAVTSRAGTEAALARAVADRDATAVQLKAERRGIYLQSGFGGSSYHLQRLDEIRVRQIELRHQIGTADADIQSLRTQLDAEDRRLAQVRTIQVLAAAGGQIASVYVSPGTQVLRGNPLADVLDCGNLYVEANVAVGWFNRPRPGSKVNVRIYDMASPLRGTVRALRDSAMAMDPSRTTPVADRPTRQQLTLLVDLDQDDRAELLRLGCPVGRPATLSFE